MDGAIILETGTNEGNNMLIPEVGLSIGKENKMEGVERPQYQHNGSGTAILLNERFKFRLAKELFNNDK